MLRGPEKRSTQTTKSSWLRFSAPRARCRAAKGPCTARRYHWCASRRPEQPTPKDPHFLPGVFLFPGLHSVCSLGSSCFCGLGGGIRSLVDLTPHRSGVNTRTACGADHSGQGWRGAQRSSSCPLPERLEVTDGPSANRFFHGPHRRSHLPGAWRRPFSLDPVAAVAEPTPGGGRAGKPLVIDHPPSGYQGPAHRTVALKPRQLGSGRRVFFVEATLAPGAPLFPRPLCEAEPESEGSE